MAPARGGKVPLPIRVILVLVVYVIAGLLTAGVGHHITYMVVESVLTHEVFHG